MAADALGILGAHGMSAAELVADAVRASDPQAAGILDAQAAWLRGGGEAARRVAAERIHAVTDPKNLAAWRSQIDLGDVFPTHLTVLSWQDRSIAWIYDDDIVSLEDGRPTGRVFGDVWQHNTDADRALGRLLASEERGRLCAVRMLVFEGTARMGRTLRAHGAADLVTHLELRLQRACEEGPVARAFPSLSGMCCEGADLEGLLAERLPSLRALVVRGPVGLDRLLASADRAPGIRHLGVHYERWDEASVGALLRHAIVARLTGLELYDVNHARGFPFDAFVSRRDRWEHLALVGLPGHGVPPEIRAAFADAPQVIFVGHDRRETIALDFETHGWADSTR